MHEDDAALIACLPRLRRYARALVGDLAGADDLVQDTMERAWQRLSSWRRSAGMRPWLFSIMHNLHVDQLRQQRVPTVPYDDATPDVAQAPQAGPLDARDMQSALAILPPEQRAVLLLVALEEMTYEEVAAALSIPMGTVMSRLSRAREKLRAHMAGRDLPVPLKVVK
jgi:RNA polymerase sigma factor (sigma-70 family)